MKLTGAHFIGVILVAAGIAVLEAAAFRQGQDSLIWTKADEAVTATVNDGTSTR